MSVWSLAGVLILLAVCACDVESGEARCAPVAAALFHGSVDSGLKEQRLGIGALVEVSSNLAVCTATLVGDGVALTAAHCADFGELELRFDTDGPALQTAIVAVHPDLDVMLLNVEHLNPGSASVAPIALFEGPIRADWKDRQVILAGVGRTELGTMGELRFLRESIVDVTATEIWVDGMGQSGACAGDSGGPLLVEPRPGFVQVAGVLDRGSSNCLGVDVYTKAESIFGWAADHAAIARPAQDTCL